MSGRRSSHINFWWDDTSDDVFQIYNRTNNAQVTGARFGWFKMEYDSVRGEIRLRFYANKNDAAGDYQADSGGVLTSTLPASVSLAEAASSGVTATVYVDGLSI